MVTETDLALNDGRTLHVYDTGPGDTETRLLVFWHHGTPNVGAPPEPLLAAAAERGVRWVSHDRPGYGGSTPHPGRAISSVAADVAAIADALGVEKFAVMGHSGGGSHALACAALLPERVLGAVCVSGLAPVGVEGLDWFAGMSASGERRLRAASEGRAQLEDFLSDSEFDPDEFTPADHDLLSGEWSWLGEVAEKAIQGDPGGMMDDELAYVAEWGCDLGQVRPPVLLIHGGQDRIAPSAHAEWLANRCDSAKLWLRPDEGHISVLSSAVEALDWLLQDTARK
ncbi:alpha/beta fold hydrolase [Amycolatopsis sp. cmx-11-12]|uniref:alpha/beta fold hydrolase n=1 Tax=Amycolatopsis sp. cmx-11-12 TaxID=2785795 RepID=UPI0039181FA3